MEKEGVVVVEEGVGEGGFDDRFDDSFTNAYPPHHHLSMLLSPPMVSKHSPSPFFFTPPLCLRTALFSTFV